MEAGPIRRRLPPRSMGGGPHCAQRIVARRRNCHSVLLRAADVGPEEATQAAARHREAMLRQANEVDVSDSGFEEAEQALNARSGAPVSPSDALWPS